MTPLGFLGWSHLTSTVLEVVLIISKFETGPATENRGQKCQGDKEAIK